MASIERIATNAREVFRRGIVFPDAAAGGGVIERERRVTGNCSQEIRVGAGLDPAEILDAESGRVGFEPENGRPETEVEKSNAALAVGGGEEEVRGGGLGGKEVQMEGEWGPADGGDERGEGNRGSGGRRHGEDGDLLHRP